MNAFKLCLISLFAAAFIAACNQAATTPNTANTTGSVNKTSETVPAQSATPIDEVAMAQDLYATNCQICHKDTGKGGKVTVEGKKLNPIDLTSDKVKNRSDDKLANQISEGAPDDGMPAFKVKLDPDQIKLLVKHLRTLQSK